MITETGYHRDTFEEILSDLEMKSKELYGEDIETSDQSYFGKLLNLIAYVRAKDHELAEKIYYSRFPNTAIETGLDRLCPFSGLSRNVAIPARYNVTVTGTAGTVIPIGFLVSTESGIEFYCTMETTIPEEGTTTIVVECTESGIIGNVSASDITEVVNPEAGIDGILGVSVVTLGESEESDFDLRKRITIANEGSGSGNTRAIRAALFKIPTVTSVMVIENDQDVADEYGHTPHSVACYVTGGEDYVHDIGEAIFNTKPLGIPTNGNISVVVKDDGGYEHTVKYSKIPSVPVNVAISIITTVNFEGSTGVEEIKKNVMEAINDIGVGNDVVLSKLYEYIYAVNGVGRVTSLTLNGGTSDISVSALESALCNSVTVTEV